MLRNENSGPIVAVDDDPGYLFLLKMSHKKLNISKELLLFESGRECLGFLKQISLKQEEFPSIILLDINMPELNGIQTLEAIRALQGYSSVPVIFMLTSSDDLRDKEKAQKVGANGYINKSDCMLEKILLGDFSH